MFNQNYDVTVIWCPLSPWADKLDSHLFQKYIGIKWIKAGYHKKNQSLLYSYARLRQSFWAQLYKIVGNEFNADIKSIVLFSQNLQKKAMRCKADLYIGHNLGSLPAIVKAARKFNAKCIFDFEDYHRGENLIGSSFQNKVISVENRYIPKVNFISAASPDINLNYQFIFQQKNIVTINNVFTKKYGLTEIKKIKTFPIKLFWFSQYIGKNRGIETVLYSMAKLFKWSVTLTLLGSCTQEIKNYLLSIINHCNLHESNLIFIDPVSESEIIQIASEHHLGLCAEHAYIENRNLCLTNKLFMYLLAGNALLMTDTKAQKRFLEENKDVGFIYEQENANSLAIAIKYYIDNPDILVLHRMNALQLAKNKHNWEIEQHKFLDNIKTTLVS